MIDAQLLAERYAALWNETDPATRRATIEALWRPDGHHFVNATHAQGFDALEQRVRGSHEKNVRDAGHSFRLAGLARQLLGVVTFNWQMVQPATSAVLATGLEFLEIDDGGRIVRDWQFIVG
ncbi:hypothetical protein [Roseateles paludis]|jgi:hypothetical protein|uniref:SnoaL-like domain-containing protein n=1 Tax=Roseateles paludis TaxID=3145238 RepID=A0ABV0G1S6_9BURK